jgi:putative glutamine amidotransferase
MHAASAPLIGVTTYLEQAQTGVWDVPASFLPKVYLDAVTDAGGIAVLLPPQPVSRDIARSVVSSLDGLIVAGGADVDPARYGQEAHPRTGVPRTDRDAWEDALLTEAIAIELPFLGICRGAQVLNVALGGTLHQDVAADPGTQIPHGQKEPRDQPTHKVTVAPGSRLAEVLGTDELEVNSMHHQAIHRLGRGLTAVAWAPDQLVEGAEIDDPARFVLGVQWHPEELVGHSEPARRLFSALVAAARKS